MHTYLGTRDTNDQIASGLKTYSDPFSLPVYRKQTASKPYARDLTLSLKVDSRNLPVLRVSVTVCFGIKSHQAVGLLPL